MDSWDGAVNHEANAHLIAAAPSMRLALEAIAGMTTDDTTNHAELAALCIAIAQAELENQRKLLP